MEILRIFRRPSETFEISQKISWKNILTAISISSIIYAILRYPYTGSLIFFVSDMISFLFLVIFISLLHAPLYYLFLKEYYNLEGILKGVFLLTMTFFIIAIPGIISVALAYLIFYTGVFANVQKVFENKLEALIIVIFPAILLGSILNNVLFINYLIK